MPKAECISLLAQTIQIAGIFVPYEGTMRVLHEQWNIFLDVVVFDLSPSPLETKDLFVI